MLHSVWVPGPEDSSFQNNNLMNGFVMVLLQDMIERAAMEEILDKKVVTPGVYLHEMPYPCFKEDTYVTE